MISNILLENGRINLEGLNGIADHLRALEVTNRTLDLLKDKLDNNVDVESDWHRRATAAHKAWFWMRKRICERLAVLRREEKELNILRARFEDEELLLLLRKQVTKADLSALKAIARAKAEERLQEQLKTMPGTARGGL